MLCIVKANLHAWNVCVLQQHAHHVWSVAMWKTCVEYYVLVYSIRSSTPV